MHWLSMQVYELRALHFSERFSYLGDVILHSGSRVGAAGEINIWRAEFPTAELIHGGSAAEVGEAEKLSTSTQDQVCHNIGSALLQ